MNDLQKKLFDILVWFDGVCRENNLRYYMIGGTMLGAARHEGFIPWDDDIDVAMPRKDYEKMISLLSQGQTGTKYELETPDMGSEDFYYPFSKIYDTETTLIENSKYKIKRGIYLDVFPLDGIGNSREEAIRNYKKIKRLYTLLLSRVTGIRKGRRFYKNAIVVLMRLIPEWMMNNKKILQKLVSSCKRLDFDECEYVGNLVGAAYAREIVPESFFGQPKDYDFEGIKVCGVAEPDKYLTAIYGDWRKLPPVEKRVTRHDSILMDLTKSYKQ